MSRIERAIVLRSRTATGLMQSVLSWLEEHAEDAEFLWSHTDREDDHVWCCEIHYLADDSDLP